MIFWRGRQYLRASMNSFLVDQFNSNFYIIINIKLVQQNDIFGKIARMTSTLNIGQQIFCAQRYKWNAKLARCRSSSSTSTVYINKNQRGVCTHQEEAHSPFLYFSEKKIENIFAQHGDVQQSFDKQADFKLTAISSCHSMTNNFGKVLNVKRILTD